MKNMMENKKVYECDVCGATSDKPETCCGQSMKKTKNSSLQNRTEGNPQENSRDQEPQDDLS